MNNKPNILFVITKSEIGGAQKFVKEQIDICHPHFNIFLATNEPGWLTMETQTLVTDVLIDKRIEKRTSVGFLFALRNFLRQHKIGVVVANSANGGLYGRIAAKLAGAASIYVSHGWSSVYNGGKLAGVLNMAEKFLAQLGNKVLCISTADYQTAKEKIKIPESKLVLLKNCIFPVGSLAQSRLTDGKPLRLLSVARFAHPKRMDLLTQAMENFGNVELHLIGNGPEFAGVQRFIQERGLTNIHLHGEVRNFNDFGKYDGFILISDSEGLPMSALEAMSAGLPLILSDVGGCAEIVVHSELLVRNETKDIQKAIRQLHENYHVLQPAMEPYFNEHFNLDIKRSLFLDLYKGEYSQAK